jgi:hypothetical protein
VRRRLGDREHVGVVVDGDDVIESVQQRLHDESCAGADVE